MAVCTMLLLKLYPDFREKEHTKQEIVNCSFKMFKVRFLRSSKCLKTIWNLPGHPVELNQKSATATTPLHSWYSYSVAIVGHYYAAVVRGL